MRTLCFVAMLTPPWNLFWWVVGLALYYGSRADKEDHSGDGFLYLVLGAPVTLPGFLFSKLRGWCSV